MSMTETGAPRPDPKLDPYRRAPSATTGSGRPSSRGIAAAAAAAFVLASLLSARVTDLRSEPAKDDAGLWLRASPLTKRLAFGFDNLAADIYWMRTVVYFGDQRRSQTSARTYGRLYPYLDLVTTFDPRFRVAYRFGAIFLAEAYPGGAGRPELAKQLLERALQHQPDGWEYMHDIAFLHYWWLHDLPEAAAWFDKAASLPGAPSWLGPLAAVTLTQGGDRVTARRLWQQLAEGSETEWVRSSAVRRLQQLDAMDAIDRLNDITSRLVAAGNPPRSWQDVVAARALRGVPLDPAGVPFVLEPDASRVSLSRQSPLWPLPSGEIVRMGV